MFMSSYNMKKVFLIHSLIRGTDAKRTSHPVGMTNLQFEGTPVRKILVTALLNNQTPHASLHQTYPKHLTNPFLCCLYLFSVDLVVHATS